MITKNSIVGISFLTGFKSPDNFISSSYIKCSGLNVGDTHRLAKEKLAKRRDNVVYQIKYVDGSGKRLGSSFYNKNGGTVYHM